MGLLWFVTMFVVYSVIGWFLACDCGVLLLLWRGCVLRRGAYFCCGLLFAIDCLFACFWLVLL